MSPNRPRSGRWLRRAGVGAGVALILFTVVGFFVVPPVARHIAQTQLGQALGRRVARSVPGSGARLFLVRPRLDPDGARVDFRLEQE